MVILERDTRIVRENSREAFRLLRLPSYPFPPCACNPKVRRSNSSDPRRKDHGPRTRPCACHLNSQSPCHKGPSIYCTHKVDALLLLARNKHHMDLGGNKRLLEGHVSSSANTSNLCRSKCLGPRPNGSKYPSRH